MSLDVIRGAVMVLMAIDHVRVYSGQPAGGPTPGIFFTRWVTNFCATWRLLALISHPTLRLIHARSRVWNCPTTED